MDILEFKHVKKVFTANDSEVEVLDNVNFQLSEGEVVSVVGPSGSGKSTFLSVAAGLEEASAGTVKLCGDDLASLSEDGRSKLRRDSVGFVFQNFELLPTLSAVENVMVPAELVGNNNARKLAEELLEQVGLSHRLGHLPIQLSGGEKQRVAIARAFINQPKVLFADEPTGNLDRKSSGHIVELLFKLNTEVGTSMVVATHDLSLAKQCQRIFEMIDGSLEEREPDEL